VATKTPSVNKTAEKKRKDDNDTAAAATKTPSGQKKLKSIGSPRSKGSPKKGTIKSGMSLEGDSETNDHDLEAGDDELASQESVFSD
jgi:hypothetical protein